MFRRECMKEDKKKILTAAAFLIAAGLVFGMTRSRSGIQKLDESGAVVMSGSLDADGNISWEKNGSAKSDGLPQNIPSPNPAAAPTESSKRLHNNL